MSCSVIQWLPLMRAVEEFAHRDRRCTVLPNLPEVPKVFGRERVLEKKHSELLSLLAELHCFIRRQAFMHIVK